MNEQIARAATAFGLCTVLASNPLLAQDGGHDGHMGMDASMNTMWHWDLGSGWQGSAMGQVFPVVTIGAPGQDEGPLKETGWYLTQPAVMVNLTSPGQGLALRTTLNFEGITQEDGELTYGGWGEGFIDKRHPHTLLHEFVLSLTAWDSDLGDVSLSAGKGFAPYGTDDPMSRPGLKYPTNHHLSQVLERWFVSGAVVTDGWGFEASVFGGAEPEDPYDFGNISSFGDSWSARVSRRWSGDMGAPGWELSVSHADIAETHHEEVRRTRLWNTAIRYEGAGPLRYGLVEGSTGSATDSPDLFSVLGEVKFGAGRHQPYLRLEYASRPEYERDPFFRYDHDAHPVGSTKWLISTVAYELALTDAPWGVWPFIEVQHHAVREGKGSIGPRDLFGTDSVWSFTLGARVLFGGDPMRMGVYGALDPMVTMLRMPASMESM